MSDPDDHRGAPAALGASLFPPFRDFYRDHNPQFMGVWPCPPETMIPEFHKAMAETMADYMDMIASVMEGRL